MYSGLYRRKKEMKGNITKIGMILLAFISFIFLLPQVTPGKPGKPPSRHSWAPQEKTVSARYYLTLFG
jgi:hypothetical protein